MVLSEKMLENPASRLLRSTEGAKENTRYKAHGSRKYKEKKFTPDQLPITHNLP